MSYYYNIKGLASIYTGKYYTSGGKIYISGLEGDTGNNWGNKVVEYKIGSENGRAYLTAHTLNFADTYYKNNPNMKFRWY